MQKKADDSASLSFHSLADAEVQHSSDEATDAVAADRRRGWASADAHAASATAYTAPAAAPVSSATP